MALDRLADLELKGQTNKYYLELKDSLNKYYYEGIIENRNLYVLITKSMNDMNIFKDGVFDVGIILTTEIFDEEVTKLDFDDFKKLNKLNITSIEYSGEYKRNDKNLIKVVEELGNEVNTSFSYLTVVEIPDGSFWKIDDYDGWEKVTYSESEIKVAGDKL